MIPFISCDVRLLAVIAGLCGSVVAGGCAHSSAQEADGQATARILRSKRPSDSLTSEEKATIAREHAQVLSRRVRSEDERMVSTVLQPWLRKAEADRKAGKTGIALPDGLRPPPETAEVVKFPTDGCTALPPIRPPYNGALWGSSDLRDTAVPAVPPVVFTPPTNSEAVAYVSSAERTFPIDGILSVGAEAGRDVIGDVPGGCPARC